MIMDMAITEQGRKDIKKLHFDHLENIVIMSRARMGKVLLTGTGFMRTEPEHREETTTKKILGKVFGKSEEGGEQR